MCPGHGDTPGYLQVDAEIAGTVGLDQCGEQPLPLGSGMGVGQVNGAEAVVQSFQVSLQADQLTTIAGDDFVNPVAEEEAPVHRRHPGVFQWAHLTVEIGCGHSYCPR